MLLYRKRVTIYTQYSREPRPRYKCTCFTVMCACPASEYQSKQFSYVHTIVAHQFPSQNWSITAQCKTKRHHHGLARSRPYLVVEQYFNVGCFCGVLRWRLHATYCRFQLTTQSTHGDAHLNSSKRVGRAAYQLHSSLQ